VRHLGFEPRALRLEGACAIRLRQRRERAAQRTRTPAVLGKSQVPVQSGASGAVGRAGLEPAYLLLIRQLPSPAWPPASWPPRNRTERYLFIRQDPSPVGLRILKRRDRESDPEGSSRRSAVFGTAAVARRLASPSRNVLPRRPTPDLADSLLIYSVETAKMPVGKTRRANLSDRVIGQLRDADFLAASDLGVGLSPMARPTEWAALGQLGFPPTGRPRPDPVADLGRGVIGADGGRIEHPQDASPDLRFPAGYLATRSAILARKVLGSNQRTTHSRDLGLANRRLTARPTFPAYRPRDSNPDPPRSERGASYQLG
jgi:hypothetical protein